MTIIDNSVGSQVWTLTEHGCGDLHRRTHRISATHCIVGRGNEADLCIAIASISKRHARLFVVDGQLHVEDLGSTNGTHLNGEAIQRSSLVEGDLIQFSNAVYLVGKTAPPAQKELAQKELAQEAAVQEGLIPWAQTLLSFDHLLSQRAVVPAFQPIVTMDRKATPGFEILARSDLPELKSPAAMFHVAERLGQEAVLSEMMRHEGAKAVVQSGRANQRVFLNTHPAEFGTERLVNSLQTLRSEFPKLRFVIEVSEDAVTQISQMKELRAMLQSVQMQLCYDDFAASQDRLLELAEAPPDVLKFDMQLIRDIDNAPMKRQDSLRSLVQIAIDFGSVPLAEGVETEAEHAVCFELGFRLGQGYLYGRPQPLIERRSNGEDVV